MGFVCILILFTKTATLKIDCDMDNNRRGFTTLCCSLPCTICLFAGFICYHVYGIKFLIEDRYVCGGRTSALWTYSLLAILYIVQNVCTQIAKLNQATSARISQIYLIIVFIFGSIVIFSPGYVCDELKLKGLWVWAQVSYYVIMLSVLISCCSPTPMECIGEGSPLVQVSTSPNYDMETSILKV